MHHVRKGSLLSGPQEPYPQQSGTPPRRLPPPPQRQPRQPPDEESDGGGQRRRDGSGPDPAGAASPAAGQRLATEQSRRRASVKGRRRPLALWAGAGGLVLLVALGITILLNVSGSTSNQARGLAEDFTDLVITGDTAKAYREYLDPALQEQLSKEQFMTGLGTLKLDKACESDFTVGSGNGGDVKRADVTGLITCGERKIDLSYRFEGADQLKMTSITLRPAG